MLGAAAAVLPLGARGRLARRLAALAVALASGGLALGARLDEARSARPTEAWEGVVEASVSAVVPGPSSTRIELRDAVGIADTASVPRRLRVYADPSPSGVGTLTAAQPGFRLRGRLRLRAPHSPRNPGGSDRNRVLERAGVGAVGRLVHPALHVRLVDREGVRPLAWLHTARTRAAAQLVASGRGGPLLAALALGDRGALEPDTRDAFARVGLAHLLAVSGLHVGLVAGLAYIGSRRLLAHRAGLAARIDVRRPALGLAVGAGLLYALLAGWGVPVRRAVVWGAALGLCFARGRPGLRAEPLAAAALLVLTFEPHALYLPGAQLSFAASAALAGAASRPRGPAPGRLRRLSGLLRTSATALAATAPLAAFHFGQVAPWALLTNLVAVPWTAVVLLPASLAATLVALIPSGVGVAVIGIAEHLAALSLGAVEWAADEMPGARGAVSPPTGWWLAVAAASVQALRVASTRGRVLWTLVGSGVLALAPPAPIGPPAPRLVVFDVGQGDAVLVQGRRASLLVDAGRAVPGGVDLGRREVVPALRALGIDRLDWLVASHADLDHRGGLPAVLREIDVGELWLPHGGLGDPDFDALVALARSRGVAIAERGLESSSERIGDLGVTPLWPPRAVGGLSRNDRSLVLRVEVGGRRVLLPGDLEATGEARLLESGADLRADLLKLAHHGSRTSSGRAFLRAVDASLAIASAPVEGRHPLPHPDVAARLHHSDVSLWWTGRDGAVAVGLGDRPGGVTVWGAAD